MRLYPGAMFLMRTCTQETTLAGINFKPGMNVDIPVVGIHYDPEFYPDPESFKPERFLPENKDSHTPYTFLPFGSGPRSCVGMRLGYLTVKVVMVCLLQHVKFGTCPETMVRSPAFTTSLKLFCAEECKAQGPTRDFKN
ncbi:putative cytochrome P450 [Ixodes scapularis]